jgi:hypothetical protein
MLVTLGVKHNRINVFSPIVKAFDKSIKKTNVPLIKEHEPILFQ